MALRLEVINPIEYRRWNDLLISNQDYSFFHSSNWAQVLCESYGYKPLYFTSVNNGRLSALVPVMEIKSFITGRRGVSLPFSDYCEPLVSEKGLFQDVVNRIIEHGREAGWRSVELRGGKNFPQDVPPSSYYYTHTLELSEDEEQVFDRFRSSTKRNIKKAVKEGVAVSIHKSAESVKEFYRLNCMTRKQHGLPPQPYRFFKAIYEHIISRGLGFVVLASYGKKSIAGAVYFHLGRKVFYKYGASDRRYQHLRANNLVMWEAIKWYCQNGYKSFCFGRTEPENKGLMQFKAGWGVKEKVIKYFKYDIKRETFVKDCPRMNGLHNRVFSKMPIPLLTVIGSLLYRHIG